MSRRSRRPRQPPALAVAEPAGAYAVASRRGRNAVVIHNAREHNLKNIDVEIPRDHFTVITGVSGSGKSTLAFDILFNEGQRRYLESLNAYARQFVQPAARPDVDAIYGIPPTVAIEQRTSRGGRKSTVATLTEIYHFLRLLYVKLGTQYCPDCDVPIEPQSPASIAARLLRDYKGKRIALLAPLVVARKGYYTDLAKWAAKKGFRQLRVDGAMLPTSPWPRLSRFKEHTIELPVAEVDVSVKNEAALRAGLARALDFGKGLVHVLGPKSERVTVFSTKRACPSCGRSFAELDPRLFSFNSKHGWCETCFGTGVEIPGFERGAQRRGDLVERVVRARAAACGTCAGERLNPTALNVRFRERSIAGAGRAVGRGQPGVLREAAPGAARARDRPRPAGRDPRAAEIPRPRRPGLPAAGPLRADPLRRRSAAHPPGRAAGLQPAGRLLRAGRADDRPAPARQRDPARLAQRAGQPPQHAGRRRARRGHHPARRLRAGPGPAGRRARRRGGRRRHREGPHAQPALGHRPLPARAAAAPGAAAPQRHRRHPAPQARARGAAQHQGLRGQHPARPAGGHHRRVRLGQVDGRPRRAVREPAAPAG